MFKVLVVDDEKYIRDELKYFIQQIEGFKVIGETGNGDEVIDMTLQLKPDILFLDVELRYVNGMTLARQILQLNKSPRIIVSTAFDKYAVMGFELSVSDYILKPFSLERIKKALDKAVSDINKRVEKIDDRSNVLERLAVNDKGRILLIELKEVYYFQAKGNGSELILKNNIYDLTISLKELEAQLPVAQFFRIHKSYIVNIGKIKEIIPWFNYTCKLYLHDINDELTVSRKYYKTFKERFLMR